MLCVMYYLFWEMVILDEFIVFLIIIIVKVIFFEYKLILSIMILDDVLIR